MMNCRTLNGLWRASLTALLTTALLPASLGIADSGFRTQLAQVIPPQSCDGSTFELAEDSQYYVFLFTGVECPVARQYGAKLQTIADQFKGQPVQFIGVNSNPQDTQAEVVQYQQDLKIQFPFIKDSSQLLAKNFQVKRTAEAVLVDANGKVLYQGRIDDQYSPGVAKGTTNSHDLRDAVSAVLAGQPVANARTTPVGCLITYKKDAAESPTTSFTKDIAPLLWQHCYECHRAGEIGPFDISDYEDLQGWGEMLVEVMEQKRMPPWHASPEHGSFKNERQLPEGMVELVRTWISEGMPYGNPAELPVKPIYPNGWNLPTDPDFVVQMRNRPYRVPAEGVIDYQYFVVDPGFTEDRWVSASQVIPGSPSVVHHVIVFVRPPDNGQFLGIGWLNAYVPGQKPVIYPEGYARRIPAGSKLVFQMHYTTNGVVTEDISKIGLCFVEEDEVSHQIFTTVAIDQDFEIPPGVADFPVSATMMNVHESAELLAISPHMHLRGKAFDVFTKKGDSIDTILKVPHYDFNWQHTYELSKPLPLKDFDSVDITAVFDNSKGNPFNPNPEEYVMWGDQTWEEMALGYFDVAIPYPLDSTDSPRNQRLTRSRGSNTFDSKEREQRKEEFVKKYVNEMLTRFDQNQDGVITRDEASQVFRDFGFWAVDKDRDGKITQDELTQTARGRRGI